MINAFFNVLVIILDPVKAVLYEYMNTKKVKEWMDEWNKRLNI